MCVLLFHRELSDKMGRVRKTHTALIRAMSSYPSLNHWWDTVVTQWLMLQLGLYQADEAVTTFPALHTLMMNQIYCTCLIRQRKFTIIAFEHFKCLENRHHVHTFFKMHSKSLHQNTVFK